MRSRNTSVIAAFNIIERFPYAVGNTDMRESFETERLVIRRFLPGDATDLFELRYEKCEENSYLFSSGRV